VKGRERPKIDVVWRTDQMVRHPEYAAMSPDCREMIVYDDEGNYYAETLMIDLIEEAVPTPQSGPDGDGA
jgi:hypothetical protein